MPRDWNARRKAVLLRDGYRCKARGDRCEVVAHEVDHVTPESQGGTHNLTNLQAICKTCHRQKTGREGQQARLTRARPKEQHPGIIA